MDKRRILVVDDDSLFRSSIVEILSRKGFEITEAASGSDALVKHQVGVFDLVVSDFKMPNMTGIELLEKLAAEGVKLNFGIDNLLDKLYYDHLGGINRVSGGDVAVGARLPSAGRFAFAQLVWTL
jgi:hypothetical protein